VLTCPTGPDGEVRHLFVATKRTCACGQMMLIMKGRAAGKTEQMFDDLVAKLQEGWTVWKDEHL
jgi:hypothetical protein